jgi:hypothetical protein
MTGAVVEGAKKAGQREKRGRRTVEHCRFTRGKAGSKEKREIEESEKGRGGKRKRKN